VESNEVFLIKFQTDVNEGVLFYLFQAPSYATVKIWVVQFKRGDFSNCDAPSPG